MTEIQEGSKVARENCLKLLDEGARLYSGSRVGFALGEWQRRAREVLAEMVPSGDVVPVTDELAELRAAYDRLLANESNHYDRYWTPAPNPLTVAWLDATEAKMREALTDVFCDDAASVMLELIGEIRRLRVAHDALLVILADARYEERAPL